jgi:hypothetical protein
MRYFIVCFILILSGFTARSQNFNYSVTTSTEPWQELNSQTILNTNNSAWNFSYKIPVGFTFNYLGRNFDSLTIETNGYIVFDADHHYSFTAYNNLADRLDATGTHAIIGYQLSGGNGSRVLKIQFKKAGLSLDDPRSVSYQVWFRENNTIEVHCGPTDFRPHIASIDTSWASNEVILSIDTLMTEIDSTISWRIGLINQNMDAEVNGYFIKANPDAPSSSQSDADHEPCYLNAPPRSGTRYTFSPIVN